MQEFWNPGREDDLSFCYVCVWLIYNFQHETSNVEDVENQTCTDYLWGCNSQIMEATKMSSNFGTSIQ